MWNLMCATVYLSEFLPEDEFFAMLEEGSGIPIDARSKHQHGSDMKLDLKK